jgi:hypothetical protein
MPEAASLLDSPALTEMLNGFAAHWGHLAASWDAGGPGSASQWQERRRMVEEFSR